MVTSVRESLTCPSCSHIVVTEKTVGRRDAAALRCPHCKVDASLGSWRTEPAILADTVSGEPPPIVREIGYVDAVKRWFHRNWPRIAIVCGILAWLVSVVQESILSYPAIVLAGAGATTEIVRRLGQRLIAFGVVATVLLVCAWARQDTYQERWSNDATDFVDTYKRWGDQRIYRRATSYEMEDGKRAGWSASHHGPVAGTGKPHGEWELIVWKPQFSSTKVFYWYGEDVSEGDWHLRNGMAAQ